MNQLSEFFERSGLKGTEYHFSLKGLIKNLRMKTRFRTCPKNRKKVQECLPGKLSTLPGGDRKQPMVESESESRRASGPCARRAGSKFKVRCSKIGGHRPPLQGQADYQASHPSPRRGKPKRETATSGDQT